MTAPGALLVQHLTAASATGPSLTMPTSSAAPASATITPCKLHDDDEDDDHVLLQGGPFENTKRKCSWSATSMRKELGSPRMTSSDHYYANAGFDFDRSKDQLTLPKPNRSSLQGGEINIRKTDRSRTRNTGSSFLQELGSALVSCGGGATEGSFGRTRGTTGNNASTNSTTTVNSNSDIMNVAINWVRLKDSFQKAVKGDLGAAKEAWRRSAEPVELSYEYGDNSVGSHDSILTYDNYAVFNPRQAHRDSHLEEEAMQLRRLTSWGTVGTYETVEGMGTNYSNVKSGRALFTSASTNADGTLVVEDDDGMPIDIQLLQTRRKKLQLSSGQSVANDGARRKRVVRFDYPPISSLRECPRTQPEQIQDLFFTERELEQIEDDRYCTISADDVEIVAISTSTTADSDSFEEELNGKAHESSAGRINTNSKHPFVSRSAASSTNNNACLSPNGGKDEGIYSSAPPARQKKESKKGRRTFSFDDVANRGVASSNSTATNDSFNNKKSTSRRRGPSNDTSTAQDQKGSLSSSGSSKRMIKSVQIYLRERSVG